jgi:signal transduction histidine kinase/ligand-binding sensor domain-containing protein
MVPHPVLATCALTLLSSLSVAGHAAGNADLAPPQFHMSQRSVTLPVEDANDIAFSRIGSDRGFSQARVGNIVQDNQGFMWFGTQYGLNRYDGYNFKVFAHDPTRAESLGGVNIKALFKDRDGTLWIGCDQRLDRFDPMAEAFVHYRIRTGEENRDATIGGISQDAAGLLWLATDGGLVSFDPKTGQTRNFRHDAGNPHSLGSDAVKFAGEDKGGDFWVANSSGLELFDRTTGRVTERVPLPEMRELSFFEDREGTFWIFHASGSGLATFDRRTKTLTHYMFDDRGTFTGPHVAIFSMIEDSTGVLWFGTAGSGLFRLDREHRRFTRYRNYASDPQSLATDNLVSLFEDRDGNIWVALHGMRVNVFPSRPLPFRKLPFEPLASKTEGGTMVNAIYEAAGGDLWLSYLGSLTRVDRSTGSRESFPAATTGSTADVITMLEDAQGATWFGTSGGGLIRASHDGKWRYFLHDPLDPSSLSNDVVTRLLIDHRGGLWAATWNGLNSYDPAADQFRVYNVEDAIGSHGYISMAEDANGLIWLGTDRSGLESFDPVTHRSTHYVHDDLQPTSLSNNRVNAVFIDHRGAIWVGTQNGLDLLDRNAGQFSMLSDVNGLGGNVVSCILEDQFGKLWMSTNNGISRLDPITGHFDNYSAADGLPGPDLSGWGSCFKSPRGEMFFGGYAGATAFFPDQVSDQVQKPVIVFTEFDVAGVSANIGPRSPIKKAIGFTDEVTLSHQDNNFAVAFTALTFRNAESNRYRYRLEGLDTKWRLVDSDRRLASFTTLPPGDYRLMVQGATSRGPWSEPATLRIHMLKPWWDTWWLRSTVFSALALLLIMAYYARLEQLKIRIRERLELRHAERERIARELHDTLLQGIQAILFRLQAWGKQNAIPAEQRNEISMVATQARAIVVEGRARILSLRRTDIARAELIEALTALASTESLDHPASFQIEVQGEERSLNLEAYEHLLEIAREGIRNAFRHARADSISVLIDYQASSLRLTITDDGLGIDDSRISASPTIGHFGIVGMRERAKELQGSLTFGRRGKSGTSLALRIPAAIIYA